MIDGHVIRTPVDCLNILGAGGLNTGTIVMAYGEAGSGKTTLFAQSMALYQKDHPDAVVHYIDVENSVDTMRLEHVFKLDMDRLKVHHTATLEGAFKLILDIAEQMSKQQVGKYKDGRKDIKILPKEQVVALSDQDLFKYAEQFKIPDINAKKVVNINAKHYNNDRDRIIKALGLAGGYTMKKFGGPIPTVIMWDSIATSRPSAELEKIAEGNLGKNAAGMNVATQVISKNLSAVLGSLGGKPLTLLIPNQVRLKDFGSFFGPTESFAGSYALAHSCHYIFKLAKMKNKDSREKNYNEETRIKTGTDFTLTIEKAKFCAAVGTLKLYINDARGGIIIPKEELCYLAEDLGIVKKVHGGYEVEGLEGKYKWNSSEVGPEDDNYLSNNSKVRNHLISLITKHYRKSYYTLDLHYKDVGLDAFGKPSKEEIQHSMNVKEGEFLEESYENPFK